MVNSAAESVKKKGIGIGREDFKEIIERNAYFVDKTMMIKEVIDSVSSVTLITRPRRFGKTLNLSILRRFFEDERKADGTAEGTKVDNRYLFEGLKISQCGEEVLKHQQQYPAINLSLKSAKQPNFDEAYLKLKREIANEFLRHEYVLNGGTLSETQEKKFIDIMSENGEYADYSGAIKFLSECLAKYHGTKTIILIDEYDVPLENAYYRIFEV